MRVRDPIHGTIVTSDDEKAVIDSPFYQRLRHVRQLGFGDMAFPGATHTRHVHSMGAMHVASRLFDAVASRADLPAETCQRFRTAVRLAVLCHDLGHMPLSHASESIAPKLSALGLPDWVTRGSAPGAQASHEDYTALVLLRSSLTPVLEERYGRHGLTPEAVVSLITGQEPPAAVAFTHNGVDWSPLLRSLVSGELDADRMDYLLRDSFYTGVNYGRFDLDWLIGNLNAAVKDGKAYLALSKAAVFAFEDFLLSRYHMFVSVYYHHTSVSFDYMLKRYYEEAPGEFEIPADVDRFLECDDVALAQTLRRSENAWARRITRRQGFKVLAQFTERDKGYDLGALSAALMSAGIDHFSIQSQFSLSKYFAASGGPSLFILDVPTGRLTEVAQYTPLYQRYAGAVQMSRLYVLPEKIDAAREIFGRLTH